MSISLITLDLRLFSVMSNKKMMDTYMTTPQMEANLNKRRELSKQLHYMTIAHMALSSLGYLFILLSYLLISTDKHALTALTASLLLNGLAQFLTLICIPQYQSHLSQLEEAWAINNSALLKLYCTK